MELTVKQYEKAIKNRLSSRDFEILLMLYESPNSSMTALQLTKKISPRSDQHIIANKFIGKIGRVFDEYNKFKLETYRDKGEKRPAYFLLVGPYSPKEGWKMNPNLKKAINNILQESSDNLYSDTSLPTEETFLDEKMYEGSIKKVFVNKFERSRKAKTKCIEQHGDVCAICLFSFGEVYGNEAKGFIHVHHKIQLSQIGKKYEVNPLTDLIPVCPNCHSVIHLKKEGYSIDEVKKMIKKQRFCKKK